MLRFRLAPRFSVERDGVAIDEGDLGSRKARLLLKLLAARRGHMVAMDDVIEALWADEPPAKAEANVATLVSRLRGALGGEVVAGGRNGYRLVLTDRAILDVNESERLVEEAEHRLSSGQPALAVTAATSAIDILGTGRVLDDEPGAEWAADAGRDVERLLRRARSAAWRAHMDLDDHRAALALAQRAVDSDTLDEEAHRAVILSYHRLGEQGEALRAYQRLRTTLVEELGADPGAETEALYTAVLRGEEVADEGAVAEGTFADSDFVGRDNQLSDLLDRWAGVSRGTSTCVLLSGEAGIGKTRLANELARHVEASGAIVLRARCYEAERSLFLQPIIEVVRAAVATLPPGLLRNALGERAGSVATLVPELGSQLATGPRAESAGEIEHRRTFEGLAALLTGLARDRPVLIVLDDLHEAGASTLELLHFAMRWEQSARLMFVGTVRSDEAGAVNEQLAPVAASIELKGLDEDAVRTLADRAGFAERAATITAMTGGHTLFVVEAVRALADAPEAGIAIPQSLRDAVTARARRCGAEVDELLRAAVVIGSTFDVTALGELLGMPGEEVIKRAEPARRAGLLIEAGAGYEFSNDMVREILYETTPKPLRIVRHRRLATLLDDRPEAAARHAAAAGDVRLAVTYWRAAADHAAAKFANREADGLLTLALDAARTLEDDADVGGVLLARGRARLALGSYSSATADLTEAERVGQRDGDENLVASALTEQAWAAYYTRDMVRAGELAERAAARSQATGARAAILLGRVRNARGDLGSAITLLRGVADEAGEAADRAYALSCLGTALAHGDRYADALPILEQAVTACRQTGVLRGLLNARMFGAIVLANGGRFEAALTWAEQLAAEADRFGGVYYHPRACNILSLVWRELGEPARARDLAAEALETSMTPSGELEGEAAANALVNLAESAVHDGDPAEVSRHLEGITPLLSDRVGFAWRIELRRLEIEARLDPFRNVRLLTRAREFGSTKYEALALAGLGHVDEAVSAARRTGSPWLLAKVAPEPVARASAENLAKELAAERKLGFLERGPLLRRFRA